MKLITSYTELKKGNSYIMQSGKTAQLIATDALGDASFIFEYDDGRTITRSYPGLPGQIDYPRLDIKTINEKVQERVKAIEERFRKELMLEAKIDILKHTLEKFEKEAHWSFVYTGLLTTNHVEMVIHGDVWGHINGKGKGYLSSEEFKKQYIETLEEFIAVHETKLKELQDGVL